MATHQVHRVGAVCAIAGTLIAGISNSMHPPLTDPAGIIRNAAGTANWIIIHWGLILGIVVMQLGFYAVIGTLRASADNTETGSYGSWAIYTLAAGLVLWISVFAAEIALKPLATRCKLNSLARLELLPWLTWQTAQLPPPSASTFWGSHSLGSPY